MSKIKKIFPFVVLGLMLLAGVSLQFKRPQSIRELASVVMQRCTNFSYPVTCYEQEIPKLMDSLSMEEAFEVTKIVQDQDPRLLYCHVLAHKLSFREAEKSPEAWKDVITRCPTTTCNNGCLHGAMMERFKDEVLNEDQLAALEPELPNLCEPRNNWVPVEDERSMCYHGLGHLFMFITGADIDRSLALCEYVGQKSDGRNYVQTCSQGVFMILYQPLEPEDFALIAGVAPRDKKTRDELCGRYSGLYWESCMSESWAMFKDQMLNASDPQHLINPRTIIEFCAYAKTDLILQKCIETTLSMAAVVLVVDHSDVAQYDKLCRALPTKVQGRCYSFGAFRMLQIDPRLVHKALSICEIARMAGFEEQCLGEMTSQAKKIFHPGTVEQREYCTLLPQSWRERCVGD